MQPGNIEEIFVGDSKTGAAMRSLDWSHMPLGPIKTWPQSLRTALNILFNTCCPMVLVWGGDRLCFYNDAFSALIQENAPPPGLPLHGSTQGTWQPMIGDIEEVFSTGRSLQGTFQALSTPLAPPTETSTYSWCYSPLWDEDGQIGGVFASGYAAPCGEFSTDKTRQQLGEQLYLITNALPALIAYIDKDCHYRFNNQAYENWFGQSVDTLKGKHIREVLGETTYETLRPHITQVLSGQNVCYESEMPRRDGGTRHIRVDYIPHINDQGDVEGYFSLMNDISEQQQALRNRRQAETYFRKSEERFRLVTQAVNGLIFDWDLQTQHTYRSERLYDLIGVLPEDAPPSADWWHERIHPDDLDRLRPELLELFASSRTLYDVEYRVRHEEGHWVDVWEQASLIRDAQGQVVRIVGCTTDISDRKQAELSLRESEERLQMALEGSGGGLWDWEIEADKAYMSRRWLEMLGYQDGDLPTEPHSRTWESLIHPDDRAEVLARMQAHFQSDAVPYKFECRLLSKSGEWKWIASYGKVVMRDDQGTPLRMAGIHHDVNDRKQAEEDLRESERRFRRLVESNMFGVAFGGFTGGIYYTNDYFLNMVGYTREEIQTRNIQWTDITPAEFLPLDERAIAELKSRGVATPFEKEYLRKDGSRVPVLIGSALLQEPYDQQQEIIAFYIDLTEQKQAEAEREQLLQQAQAARKDAENANRIKDEFLAVLSHELRSPLNPILGWSHLLQTRQFDQEASQRGLQTIERNAKLQTQLIEDLLDVSRILQGKMVLNVCPVNLVAVVEAALETVRLAAEAKQIQITTAIASNDVPTMGDAARLQQIVWNLLSNAVKFTPGGGRVEVSLAQVGNYGQLQVKDTGKGISPDFLPYVFDYFRQEDGRTTRRFGGLGLGLAIVRHLTELHGGSIQAESLGEAQGATFTVQLPLVLGATEPGEEPFNTAQFIDFNHLQVLVVDDDADMRDLAHVILEQQGMRVRMAASATEALLMFDQQIPDVLISDIGMPDVDGYTLMQQIRTRSPQQGGQVPAIALTAYAGEYDQRQALQSGFQKHVAKPIEPEALICAIADLIGLG